MSLQQTSTPCLPSRTRRAVGQCLHGPVRSREAIYFGLSAALRHRNGGGTTWEERRCVAASVGRFASVGSPRLMWVVVLVIRCPAFLHSCFLLAAPSAACRVKTGGAKGLAGLSRLFRREISTPCPSDSRAGRDGMLLPGPLGTCRRTTVANSVSRRKCSGGVEFAVRVRTRPRGHHRRVSVRVRSVGRRQLKKAAFGRVWFAHEGGARWCTGVEVGEWDTSQVCRSACAREKA